MTKKFNPLSAAVAIATAGVMVTVAGCAMGTRTADESTAQAPLSREESQAPAAQQMAQANTMPSDMATTTSASNGQMMDPSAQGVQGTSPGDTSATPYPNANNSAQQAQPMAASTSTTDYSRNTGTDGATSMSSPNSSNSYGSAPASSNSDMSSSTGNEQALPPRTDRN